MNTKLDWALHYHSLGFSVFPLWKGTKDKPVTSWKRFMTERASEIEIKDWWAKYPDANIAVVTGSVSGVFVLDTEGEFDLNNIKIPDGTPTAKTGGGGRHFFFRIPRDRKVLTKIEIWGSEPKNKADIKGEGGYVVAAPSYNDAKQGSYDWLVPLDGLTEPPQWIVDLLEAEETKQEKFSIASVASGVGTGRRNTSAASFIGHVLSKIPADMWETVCWPAIESWNEKNSPPMDLNELRGIFDSISTREFTRRDNEKKGVVDLEHYEGDDKIITSQEMLAIVEAEEFNTSKYKSLDLPKLDRFMDGFVAGELIVVSGPKKHGKTTLLQTLTVSFAKQNIPCLWFTYEMTPRELLKKFRSLPIFFLPAINKMNDIKWLEQRVIEAKKKYGVKIVFVDHLGFLYDRVVENNSSISIGFVVRKLKSIARENDLVIFLVQHIKGIEAGEEPSDTHIRDSQLIPAEADSTVMVWRVPKGGMLKKKKNVEIIYENDGMMKICNHRRTGVFEIKIPVTFNLSLGAFTEVDTYHGPSEQRPTSLDAIDF